MRRFMSLVCVLLFALWGCSTKENVENTNICGFECSEADMSEYTTLEGVEHVFLDVTYEETLEYLKMEDFTGIFYFGYPACPWCEEAVVEMNDAAKSLNLEIYNVNKKSDFNVIHPEMEEEIALYLNSYIELQEDEDGNPHLYVPEVVIVKDGKVIDHHRGTLEAHDAHERTMNESEKEELEEIYLNLFQKIK